MAAKNRIHTGMSAGATRGNKCRQANNALSPLESITGSKLPATVKDELVRVADELDLVRSDLDGTMRLAYQ